MSRRQSTLMNHCWKVHSTTLTQYCGQFGEGATVQTPDEKDASELAKSVLCPKCPEDSGARFSLFTDLAEHLKRDHQIYHSNFFNIRKVRRKELESIHSCAISQLRRETLPPNMFSLSFSQIAGQIGAETCGTCKSVFLPSQRGLHQIYCGGRNSKKRSAEKAVRQTDGLSSGFSLACPDCDLSFDCTKTLFEHGAKKHNASPTTDFMKR